MDQSFSSTGILRTMPDYCKTISELLLALFGDTGMRLTVLDLEGNTIGGPPDRGEFCDYVYTGQMEQKCRECTRRGIEMMLRTRVAYTYCCHMGLASTVLPIWQDNRIIGGVLFSGYRMEPMAMARLDSPMPLTDLDQEWPELLTKYELNPFFSQDRIREFVHLLSVILDHLTKVNEHTQMLMELQSKSLELLANANLREQQEKKQTEKLRKALEAQMQDQFLFDAMGHISAVAELEHAPAIAELLQDLSTVSRKHRHPFDTVVLGQEIEDLHAYFHLLRSMYGGKISFRAEISPSCDRDLILMQLPFGTLVDLLVRALLLQDELPLGCELVLSIQQTDQVLGICAELNTAVLSNATVRQINRLQYDSDSASVKMFAELIAEQRRYYGRSVHWRCSCTQGESTSLALYLPIQGGKMQ